MTDSSQFRNKLDAGQFVTTAEFVPGLVVAAAELLDKVNPLAGRFDAVNVTDGAGARVAMSSLAASALLLNAGIEPVLQLTCRDRNRIALAADLMGAAALGIRNVLVLRGDAPDGGDEPAAQPVYDLTSGEVMALAKRMRDAGELASGRKLSGRPAFLIGGADVPFDPPVDWEPDGLMQKLRNGADFIQTQFCFEPTVAERYLARLAAAGIPGDTPFVIGVGPIASARSARWMNENLFGVSVPEAMIERLDRATDPATEGRRMCVELIRAYRDMPGVAGVHIMAPAQGAECIAAVMDELESE